jgi:Family of unknown function (DUF6526)
MPTPQNLKNHARLYPPFHFFVLPMLILNFIFSIYITVNAWPRYEHTHLWGIAMAVVLFVLAGSARHFALRAQDRIIRLEERLRLAALLPATDRAHIDELSIKQLIALRFASDAELPALAHKTLTERLEPKAIKQLITTWRSDYDRV